MDEWVKLPTKWIKDETDTSHLKSLRWTSAVTNSHNTASLMVLLAIATNTSYKNPVAGEAKLSFTELTHITSLSRKLVSEGIKKLISAGLVDKNSDEKTNRYVLCNLSNASGWGKLPARKLYDGKGGIIKAFKHFKLRSKSELNALKLYLLIVALRDNKSCVSRMSYETIMKYTGILRNDISTAVSFLAAVELIKCDKVSSSTNKHSMSNTYRLVGIDPHKHPGTSGKSEIDLIH